MVGGRMKSFVLFNVFKHVIAEVWEPITLLNAGRLDEPNEPRICDSSVQQYSGYFHAGPNDRSYFYWFFESRGDPLSDPTILWITGGPGCSGMLALIMENGPCHVVPNWQSLQNRGEFTAYDTVYNPYSWTEAANVIFIDQPTGAGFSYGGKFDHNEKQIAEHSYRFLQHFFRRFPHYNTKFSVIGESYGGHFVPAIGRRIFDSLYDENYTPAENEIKINLYGLGIGNGLVQPTDQAPGTYDMLLNATGTSPLSAADTRSMREKQPRFTELVNECNSGKPNTDGVCKEALMYWALNFVSPLVSSRVTTYDIRKYCHFPPLCYDFRPATAFFNLPDVQRILGTKPMLWNICNPKPHAALDGDFMRNYAYLIPPMLDSGKVRILVYAGDKDFMCHWIGCERWSRKLQWSGHEQFAATPLTPMKFNGKVFATFRKYKNFEFLRFLDSGHMVPMDHPASCLAMVRAFVTDNFDSAWKEIKGRPPLIETVVPNRLLDRDTGDVDSIASAYIYALCLAMGAGLIYVLVTTARKVFL